MNFLARAFSILAFALGSACAGGAPSDGSSQEITIDPDFPPVEEGVWYRPGVSTTWQWQLSGTLNASYDVDLYDIDLFETQGNTLNALHDEGRRVICYFSAGSYEVGRPDVGDFPSAVLGETLDGWPDERWLDIRSDEVIAIMEARLDLATQKGCDGVEPDNVDGYANDSGFPLTADDQLAFNRRLANEAHDRGLSVGLKNDGDQTGALVRYFDFSLNEQCHEFEECDLYDVFVSEGKPVFNAEYDSEPDLCADTLDRDFRTLILPLDLDDSSRVSCDIGAG